MVASGLCTNEACVGSARHTPIDLYPGPGRFCPDCGEALTPCDDAPAPAADARANAQRVPTTKDDFTAPPSAPPETLEERLRAALLPPPPERGPKRDFRIAGIVAAIVVVAAAAIAAIVIWGGRTGATASVTHVCTTSMTARLGDGIVRAYLNDKKIPERNVATGPGTGDVCDVRFRAGPTVAGSTVIGYDGIVLIVNPANPVTRISSAAVRDVIGTRITDWSRLGGRRAPITVYAPSDENDETRGLTEWMHGPVGPGVQRVASVAEIVKRVASPSGRNAIGVASFGDAVPAKVLAIEGAQPPSPISIAEGRYPLGVAIVVGSDLRSPPPLAADIVGFARSPQAQRIVTGAGAVGTKER